MIKRTRLVLLCLAAAAIALPAGIAVAAAAGDGTGTDPATPDSGTAADLQADLEQAAKEDPILPKGTRIAPGKQFEVTLNGEERKVVIFEEGHVVKEKDDIVEVLDQTGHIVQRGGSEALYFAVGENEDLQQALDRINRGLEAADRRLFEGGSR